MAGKDAGGKRDKDARSTECSVTEGTKEKGGKRGPSKYIN